MSVIPEKVARGLDSLAFTDARPEPQIPLEHRAGWPSSPEFGRVLRLAKADPTLYGGEARLLAAMQSAAADYVNERQREATARGAVVERAEKRPERPPPSPARGLAYRRCSACRGSLKEGNGDPCRCTKVGGHPGYEVFAVAPLAGEDAP